MPESIARGYDTWGEPLTPWCSRSNGDAIGARVTLHGEHRSWVDEVRSGSSYNSSSDLRLRSKTKINSIEVRWPNGQTESFLISGVDKYIEITEGEGSPLLKE